ncbi:hypothetical protein ACROYT_G002170 [Oculina patagonica]
MGKDYFEGDIKLTQQLSDYIKSSRKRGNVQTRALIKDARKLWTDSVVPYALADDLSEVSRGYINSAMEEWGQKTCLQFRKKTDADNDYIEFVYEEGCSSHVGRIGGRQTISVGDSDGLVVCKHGNIVHEIAHSLGFFHEHSRPDRDQYVSILWDNIKDGKEECFEKKTLETVDSLNVGYDYGSVMHFGEFFFTKTRGLKTLEPTQETTATIGQRVGLSELDARQGNLLYNCPGYRDDERKGNESKQDPTESELWDRPLREHEHKVICHRLKSKTTADKFSPSDKSSHAFKTSENTIKHATAYSRSMVLKANELKPQLQKAYRVDEADIFEGDDDEDDMLPYSRDVSTPVSAQETPNQLGTDKETRRR